VRTARARLGAGDALLPARARRALPRAHGCVCAEWRARAADALLHGIHAGRDGAAARARARAQARRARGRGGDRGGRRGAAAAAGVLAPLALALAGADYLAPRNLAGAMIPLTALLAVLLVAPLQRSGPDREGARVSDLGVVAIALACVVATAFAAITIDVALSP